MNADASMPIAEAYAFAGVNGLQAEAETIRGKRAHPRLQDKYDRVRKALLLDLLESRSLLERFVAEHWPAGSTERGQRKRAGYNGLREKNDRLWVEDPNADEPASMDEELGEQDAEQAFAMETDLRDFLACNLSVVEPGLRLYGEGERTGIEFSIDGGRGRIDVLALDASGLPVVIELKLSRGRNQTIGQLLYYMGWIDENLGKGRSRGIIMAKDISDDLVIAVRRAPGVTLFRYKIAMTVELVRKGEGRDAVPGQ